MLEQAARKESASLEDYLRRHVEGVAVSDQEVEEAYQRSRDRFLGALAPEAKYRIRRDLEDNRRSDTLRRLLERLRRDVELGRKAGVDGTPAIFVNGRRIADVGQLEGAIQEAVRQLGLPESGEAR